MTADRLAFDDRLLNKYAADNLEQSHPALWSALSAWFSAFGDFDDTAIARIAAARSPADIDRLKTAAESALASIPGIVATLDAVIAELDAALGNSSAFPERDQLEGLREAAITNRRELTDHAPALVAGAAGSTDSYDAARAEAAVALESAAARIEALRAQSEDPKPSFGEMRPMIAELKAIWADVNRALGALSRSDQRAVRDPLDGRVREAARALCRNLFARKMRDINEGAWPAAMVLMPEAGIANQFAAWIASGDYAAAHKMLAPWLATDWTAERIKREVLAHAAGAARDAGLDVAPDPAAYRVEANDLSLTSLSAHRHLPAEITTENYRGWSLIRIETDEEDGYLTDIDFIATLYAAIVATPAGERIGFLEIES